ncbi:AraC family transcriptional regulator [Pseudomonas brassicacearum subsp. neoaurantiaca]|jgi:AraC-type DNA-binding domain-containing proteins|uniref:Putative Transcription factor, AraC family n=1 Tax=Pseudomonas brassicacearum (strain NFM421) TaxID=994484 RepID=F2K7M0_PSEBN|nr:MULTISPECIES: AraC family transcriptional regulator [Pseudomonas]EIK66769.1 transcriptional regulator, AraC family [Pseudomonas fluorescens Q8r1-96]KIR17086.1 HTH-type transcriptional regulator ChbR [Pseudomonas fluorescens]AEA69611.1 putative Transcription factor, AraC family [Pseudomonas brassicacearum subsp. brassicacearum NFM421]AOS42622.1 AraC family transcriptional regulator [Pseudomonas brassicacearum]KAB0521524.1 AraC family transcriptional regulator [Pseudomonas brassicacearum subs
MKHAPHDDAPRFWRDAALPFIEARAIGDGRKVCYSRHSHDHFSIGAITAGRSTYIHERSNFQVESGTVVLMNPGDVHACNPIDDQPWSYVMLYVDTQWLRDLQRRIGFDESLDFQGFATTHSRDVELFAALGRLYEQLVDEQLDTHHKHAATEAFFIDLQQRLNPAGRPDRGSHPGLMRAAQFIHDHCSEALKLEDICTAAQLSPSYLSRAFKRHYGMTPHAFLVNRRIQFARRQLREGKLIADVALDSGFADQAHFQRAFKQHLAATPGQYRG